MPLRRGVLATPSRRALVSLAILLALGSGWASAIDAAPPAQTPGSLELLGSYVTPASTAVAAWGDLTVVGTTRGILVQDLRDPSAMVMPHDLPLGAAVQAVEVAGDSALVTLAAATAGPGAAVASIAGSVAVAAAGERRLIDLAAPGGPAIVPLPEGYAFSNLWVAGQPYIVETDASGLTVDRWTGAARARVGSMAFQGAINALAVDGTNAYVGQGGGMYFGYVSVVSLADPSHPVLAGTLSWGRIGPPYTGLYKFVVRNRLLYVAETYGQVLRLRIVDLHDPAAPVDLSTFSLAGLGTFGLHLNLSGDRLLVESSYYDPAVGPRLYMRVVTVADPAHPRVEGDYSSNQLTVSTVELHGRLIWCVTPQALRLMRLPDAPGQILDLGPTWYFLKNGPSAAFANAAYVGSDSLQAGFEILDTRDPARPAISRFVPERYPVVQGNITGFSVFGPAFCLFQSGIGGFGRFDVSNPFDPAPVDFLSLGSGDWHPISGDDDGPTLAMEHAGAAISFYDMTDPFAPRPLGDLPGGGYSNCVRVRGDLAFVLRWGPDTSAYDTADTLIAVRLEGPGRPRELGRIVERSQTWTMALRGPHLMVRTYFPDVWEGWFEGDVVFDVSDPAHMTRVYRSDWSHDELPDVWSGAIKRAYSVLGYHLQVKGTRVAVYDMSEQFLDPPLIAEWTAPGPDGTVKVAGDRIYLYTSGRLDILRFRPDAVPPRFALSVTTDAYDPSRAMVSLLGNEALRGRDVVFEANGVALTTETGSSKFFRAEIPAALGGRVTLTARAADLAGNVALDSMVCTLGSADADGGSLRDGELGLTLEVPPRAYSSPVRLVLTRATSDGTGGSADPGAIFDLKPVSVAPQVPLTVRLNALGNAAPRLQAWTGGLFSDLPVQLDRTTGSARATVDRLGRFRLIADSGTPAVARTALAAAAPNPFNARTNLAFELAASGPAQLRIYDARGRRVRTLHDGPLPAGRHGFDWDGRDGSGRALGSGLYVYRLTAAGQDITRRCMLVK